MHARRIVEEVECEELKEALTERFEETLIAPTRHLIQEHLERCEACREFVERIQTEVTTMPPDTEPVDRASWDADIARR